MKRILFLFFLLPFTLSAQTNSQLTVQKIMQDQRWIGTSPSEPFWSPTGQELYFYWNPDKSTSDSLYFITLNNHQPQKVKPSDRARILALQVGAWDNAKTQLAFIEEQTLRLLNVKTGKIKTLFSSNKALRVIGFTNGGQTLAFRDGSRVFIADLTQGSIQQVAEFKKESQSAFDPNKPTQQSKYLEEEALKNSSVLRERKAEKEEVLKNQYQTPNLSGIKDIDLKGARLRYVSVSPDNRFLIYGTSKNTQRKGTIVPNYVTQSGYTEDIPGRSVVGSPQPVYKTFIYDRQQDTVYPIISAQIPGIKDIPKFIKENYPKEYQRLTDRNEERPLWISEPQWNPNGSGVFVVVRALDHKDRWIMQLNPKDGTLKLIDRQHDDAWIGGPGVGYPQEIGAVGWIGDNTIWYQSEKTGFSHLYKTNLKNGQTQALTSGKFEILDAQLSNDHKSFMLTANKDDAAQMQFYHLNIDNKQLTPITTKEGGNMVSTSPDESNLAILYSTITQPWELYLMENHEGAAMEQITDKAMSAEYKAYPWRTPDYITFKDRDGLSVAAEVYRPQTAALSKPAVLFVHGAGYLQDVVKYWGYYVREHMFMNLLADLGYTVMDIDYRGSAGYGRDWRTAIYRHMGGNDLEDIEDGAKYLVSDYDVNPKNIGLWGGSYGGFMTLMAMFKTQTFAAGGALRSVTDWAHYNHDYTSDILNLPQNDSIAYAQSSPIYFADGLKGKLLMCHGMVDENVHFQDIVRLNQKLIELGKQNWDLAVYPVEDHGFVESSSWTDEYLRILKLFEETLK